MYSRVSSGKSLPLIKYTPIDISLGDGDIVECAGEFDR